MTSGRSEVGPILRAGELAEAVIEAIHDDNPDKQVTVVDRGDYLRISTDRQCRLTRASLSRHLGRDFELNQLEVEMPSFVGRMRSRTDELLWYYERG
jgi:hypothetical protein